MENGQNTRMVGVAQVASTVIVAAILIGGFQPFYLRIFRVDPVAMRANFTEMPYRKLPGFRRFLIEVDRTTVPRSRIAICLPSQEWDGAYGYGYRRASFLLPGKQVVSLLRMDADVPAIENAALADYVACWHGAPRIDGFEISWRNADGTLMKRVR
jgi:hypothetical protein